MRTASERTSANGFCSLPNALAEESPRLSRRWKDIGKQTTVSHLEKGHRTEPEESSFSAKAHYSHIAVGVATFLERVAGLFPPNQSHSTQEARNRGGRSRACQKEPPESGFLSLLRLRTAWTVTLGKPMDPFLESHF